MTETERAERRKQQRREWARRNPEVGKAYYEAHKEEISARQRRWREANVAKLLVDKARRRANKHSLPFDIDTAFVNDIMPMTCPVFGLRLEMASGTAGPASPSLDRIRPELGYVRGNVQVISNKANMMKQDASPEELERFARWVLSR